MEVSNSCATVKSPCRTARQTAVLQKANKHAVVALGERVPPRDVAAVRPLARRTATADAPATLLLERLLWVHSRRGCSWHTSETDIMDQVKARTWQFTELRASTHENAPIWLTELVPGRYRARVSMLSRVLAAHRAGMLGVLVSLAEWSAVLDVSESTAYRWGRDLEREGLLERVQCWQEAPDHCDRKRAYWKILYRPGPKMREAAGLGMVEGAAGLREAEAAMARRCARVARAQARARMSARRREKVSRRFESTGDGGADDRSAKTLARGDEQTVAPSGVTHASGTSPLSLVTKTNSPPPPGGRDIRRPASPRARVFADRSSAPPSPVDSKHATTAAVVSIHRHQTTQDNAEAPGRASGVPPATAPSGFPPIPRADGSALLETWLAERTKPKPKPKPSHRRTPMRCSACAGSGLTAGVGSQACDRCGGSGSG